MSKIRDAVKLIVASEIEEPGLATKQARQALVRVEKENYAGARLALATAYDNCPLRGSATPAQARIIGEALNHLSWLAEGGHQGGHQ